VKRVIEYQDLDFIYDDDDEEMFTRKSIGKLTPTLQWLIVDPGRQYIGLSFTND
jgi:hypothetical protein